MAPRGYNYPNGMRILLITFLLLSLLLVVGCSGSTEASGPPVIPTMQNKITSLEKALAMLQSKYDELRARVLALEGIQP